MKKEGKEVSLALTATMITGAKSASEVINLPAVKQSWIDKHNLVTGGNGGEAAYEGEKVMFTMQLQENKRLAEADKMSIYAAWILHGVSGLTLRDGQAYLVPKAGKCIWMPGWKGRLEQIAQRENVISVEEPEVVYSCDDFDYETTMEGKRLTRPHKRPNVRPDDAIITHVYLIVHYTYGSRLYVMDRGEVHQIRDQYSDTYKAYISKGGKWPDGKPMDKPLALSNEAQYFRKTIVKRVYNNTSKTAAQKFLDTQLSTNPAAQFADDPDDGNTTVTKSAATEEYFKDALNLQDDNGNTFVAGQDTGEFVEGVDVTNQTQNNDDLNPHVENPLVEGEWKEVTPNQNVTPMQDNAQQNGENPAIVTQSEKTLEPPITLTPDAATPAADDDDFLSM